MKILEIGPGYHKYPGAFSMDSNPLCKPDIVHNLNDYPWPIKDSEYAMIYSSHCLEHLDNPKKAIEEIWRVGKPGATVVIRVPHFSSRVAWTDVEHTRAFSVNIFRRFSPEIAKLSGTKEQFETKKIRLRWQQRMDNELLPRWIFPFLPFIKIFNLAISFLANLNIHFSERIWCYYVGGFGEVEFELKIIK